MEAFICVRELKGALEQLAGSRPDEEETEERIENVCGIILDELKKQGLTDSDELYRTPLHPYTQALISAAPIPNPKVDGPGSASFEGGDSVPHPPAGGLQLLHPLSLCGRAVPQGRTRVRDVGGSHFVACHKVTQA